VISVAEALGHVVGATPLLGGERVSLAEALARVACEDVVSARTVPAADNSAMDGYAVRGVDVATPGARLRVVGTVPAGSVHRAPLEVGTAVKIFTGSVLPNGADTIVRVEDTEAIGEWVTIRGAPKPGTDVRLAGEDIRPGQTVIRPGTVVGPADIGLLASIGRATLAVHRRPRVAIVSTGAELVDLDEPVGPGQVVNSNAYVLAAGVREAGGEPLVLPIVRDRPDAIRERLAEAAEADVILSTGGVSVGDFDFVRDALDAIGVERLFWKVAQRPGKPLTFGTSGRHLFFGLPGNPVSALVCFSVYVRPALRRLAGHRRIHLPVVTAELDRAVRKAAGLTEFVRVWLAPGPSGWSARPAASQGSGVLSSLAEGAGLLVGPSDLRELAPAQPFPVIVTSESTLALERSGYG